MQRRVSPRLIGKLERLKKIAFFAILPSLLCCITTGFIGARPAQHVKSVAGGNGPELVYPGTATGALTRLYSDVTVFRETWAGVHVSTRVRVQMTEWPLVATDPPPDRIVTRELAMEDMRDALARRCEATGDPTASDLFDSALAGGSRPSGAGARLSGGEVRRIYPWRYAHAAVFLLSMLILLSAIPAWLILAALTLHLRKQIPPSLCQSCGYDRNGLADENTCPECGAARNISK